MFRSKSGGLDCYQEPPGSALDPRDLPFLSEVLAEIGIGFTWATVKGRRNYLCRSRLAERLELEGGSSQQGLFEEEVLPETIRLLSEWADLNSTGDRDDLPAYVPDEVWSEVSVAGIECPGRDGCPQGDNCFAMAALDEAQEADVVIVNHHLYGADLMMGGSVLPEHDLVVFDEAHRLEDTMAAAFGIDMTEGRFWQFQRSATAYLGGAAARELLNDLTGRARGRRCAEKDAAWPVDRACFDSHGRSVLNRGDRCRECAEGYS